MTREEPGSNPDAISIDNNDHSPDEIKNGDYVSIVNEKNEWKVYYVRRDTPEELGAFGSLDQAHDFLYVTFRRWLGIS